MLKKTKNKALHKHNVIIVTAEKSEVDETEMLEVKTDECSDKEDDSTSDDESSSHSTISGTENSEEESGEVVSNSD